MLKDSFGCVDKLLKNEMKFRYSYFRSVIKYMRRFEEVRDKAVSSEMVGMMANMNEEVILCLWKVTHGFSFEKNIGILMGTRVC